MILPKSYKDVTISQFQQLDKLMHMEFETEWDRDFRVLSLFSGEKIADIEALPVVKFNQYRKSIQFLYDKPSLPLYSSFKLKGKKYRVTTDPKKVSGGSFIDITEWIKDKKKVTENTHLIMAAISKPYKRKWFGWVEDKDQTAEERAELFRAFLTMDKVIPVTAFFLTLSKRLQMNTLMYLRTKIQKEVQKMQKGLKDFTRAGAGTQS